jgi:endonuclease YncB( thermonuclease family)
MCGWRYLRLAVLCVLLQLAMRGQSQAVIFHGADVPDSLVVDGDTLRLNGAGLREVSFLDISVYVAALYLSAPSHDPAAIMSMPGPKVIALHFLHAATKAQVETQFRHGEEVNCGAGQCSKSDLPDFEQLIASLPALAVGDTLTYTYEPQRVRVEVNKRLIGDYGSADLSAQLLRAFIGPHPPSEEVKRGLLGLQ